jgi:hypothetical protein
VNLAEVGGVATSLGQKAEAASIPVVLATEQDTAKNAGVTAGNLTGVAAFDAFNEVWYPFPADQGGVPYSTIARDESSAEVSLFTRSTNPSSGDRGLVVRNLPSGTQNIAGTQNDATLGSGELGLMAMAYNVVDGGRCPLTTDEYGRLQTYLNGGFVSASPTSTGQTYIFTASGQTTTFTALSWGGVSFAIGNAAVYAGVTIAFEFNDTGSSAWRPLFGVDSNTGLRASTITPTSGTAYNFQFNGASHLTIRARTTAFGSGNCHCRWNASSEGTAVSVDNIVTIAPNSSVNISQMNGVAVTMNAGVVGTGVQRITLASNQTTLTNDFAPVRIKDAAGNSLVSAITTPGNADRGLVVRNVSATARNRDGAGSLAEMSIPHGYTLTGTRVTAAGSTATVINVSVDPTTISRRGDILYQSSGTNAQGQGQWAVIDSVAAGAITLQSPGFGVVPVAALNLSVYRPRWLLTDTTGSLLVTASGSVFTAPIAPNKTFFECSAIAFGSIPNSLTTFYTTGNTTFLARVNNTTDVELGYSLDTGSTEMFIPAGSSVDWSMMSIGGYIDSGTDIAVYYPGPSAPTRGRFSIELAYY